MTRSSAGFVVLTLLSGCTTTPDLTHVQQAAGDNWINLNAAIISAPDPQRDDVIFLVSQTPRREYWPDFRLRQTDAATMDADLILTHVRLAHEARHTFPWAANLDDDTFRRYVLAYRTTTERLVDWRSHFWDHPTLRPLADGYAERYRQAPTPTEKSRVFREMLHAINTEWFAENLTYAPRGMPDLDPLQAIANGTGRCTDLTATLIAILRTYGIAATGVRVVWWADADGNHAWTAVLDPALGEWLDIDSGQKGSPYDPSYFNKYVHDDSRHPPKVYWVVPGEENGEIARSLSLREGEIYPPFIEKYLVAKPVVDRTDRYTDCVTYESHSVPPDTLIWLAVWNSGMWRPVAGARSSRDGRVRFDSIARGNRYRLLTWSRERPEYCSDIIQTGDPAPHLDPPPDQAALWDMRALQLLLDGDNEKAKIAIHRSLEIRPDNPHALYNLACACSLLGEKEEALDALERAVDAGYPDLAHIKADPDLEPLRTEERYKRLVEPAASR